MPGSGASHRLPINVLTGLGLLTCVLSHRNLHRTRCSKGGASLLSLS